MTKVTFWKTAFLLCLFFVVAAIPSPAQTLTTLHSFDGTDGNVNDTDMVLVQGTDGNFYGTTAAGGAYGGGTVFKMTPGGTLTTLYSFCAQTNCTDGAYPNQGTGSGALVQASDGNFYGMTSFGGANDGCGYAGCGTIFKITPKGALTTLYSFCAQPDCTDGFYPAGLVQATDGNFYGTTQGGGASSVCPIPSHCCGTAFKITEGGTLTTLYSFCSQPNCTDGADPMDPLIQANDGNLYGTTWSGGASDLGTVFKITRSGTLTTLASFGVAGGSYPSAGLVQATDGNFYGTTVGGTSGNGTVFKMTPGGTLKTPHTFEGADGPYSYAGLVQATDGNLYGTTYLGGAAPPNCGTAVGNLSCGSVFRITLTGTLTTLYSFCPQTPCTDGAGALVV